MQKQEKTFSMEGKRVHEEGVAQASKPENNASLAEVLGSDGRKVGGHGGEREGREAWGACILRGLSWDGALSKLIEVHIFVPYLY